MDDCEMIQIALHGIFGAGEKIGDGSLGDSGISSDRIKVGHQQRFGEHRKLFRRGSGGIDAALFDNVLVILRMKIDVPHKVAEFGQPDGFKFRA